MGHLRDGVWHKGALATTSRDGEFRRKASVCRNWITADGAPGPNGGRGFPAESGRYHLYVSYACPWAHRTLIFRALKGLERHVSVDVVHPLLGDDGWTFDTGFPGATGDRLGGRRFLREVYLDHDPGITSRVTVPVLWDKETGTIVSNESAEIIRMLNSAFDRITGNTPRPLAAGAARGDRRGQRPRLRRLQQRRLPRRLRPQPGRLRARRRGGVRDARLDGGAAGEPPLAGRATGRPRPTGGRRRRCSASTSSTTGTSSATGGGSSTIRTSGPTRASSTSGRASPAPCASTISRSTITRATARSIRPASSRSARRSTGRSRTAAPRRRRPDAQPAEDAASPWAARRPP